MATPIPSTVTTPFPAFQKSRSHPLLLPARASSEPVPEPSPAQAAAEEDDDFEARLSRLRGRYRVGSGKKAERRKARKSATSTSEAAGIYLPPVALKEPKSGGVKVDFGFSPYSERVNGQMAMLGLTALLLVEMATGKGVINYHTPGVILTQLYFVAGVAALYVKYEKERVSVWPNNKSSSKE